jgi:hypothetical protein
VSDAWMQRSDPPNHAGGAIDVLLSGMPALMRTTTRCVALPRQATLAYLGRCCAGTRSTLVTADITT